MDERVHTVNEAIVALQRYAAAKTPRSIGIVGNACNILEALLEKKFLPDVMTDQTSAHDALNGYIPLGYSVESAMAFRKQDGKAYIEAANASMAKHIELLLEFKRRGSIVFDYGNNIRAVAEAHGVKDAFKIPGFVPEYIRPLFCEGAGPFRWVALSGDPEDISVTDKALLETFPYNETLVSWLSKGAPQVKFQGLPARICWLRHGEREKAGLLFNRLVREKKLRAPIVIGRDHLDCGSVASPNRETESMLDGSDAVSDWPFLNALTNAVNGASWVSVHHGGGVGMGYSQHAGMVIVADGTPAADLRLSRVLNSDPAMGILRHADAGYATAQEWARNHQVKIPMGSL